MATVQDILTHKGSEVVALPTDATVLEAARIMNAQGIGAVMVADQGVPVGIFTERDVLRRIVAEERDPAMVLLRDVMTTAVITCPPEMDLDQCAGIMLTRSIRHLPVVDASGLCGVVSSRDVLAYRTEEQQATIEYLNSYVFNLR